MCFVIFFPAKENAIRLSKEITDEKVDEARRSG